MCQQKKGKEIEIEVGMNLIKFNLHKDQEYTQGGERRRKERTENKRRITCQQKKRKEKRK